MHGVLTRLTHWVPVTRMSPSRQFHGRGASEKAGTEPNDWVARGGQAETVGRDAIYRPAMEQSRMSSAAECHPSARSGYRQIKNQRLPAWLSRQALLPKTLSF